MKLFEKLFNRIRKGMKNWGYACDACGEELFDYPVHRLCGDCEKKLTRVKNPCPKCGREGRAEGLCMDCKRSIPVFTRGISPFVYENFGAGLVNRMKNGEARLACFLGEEMGASLLKSGVEIKDGFLLTSLPMTKEGQKKRGFNQAALLAESVAEYCEREGLPVEVRFDLLVKTRETKPQKRMSMKERAENVRGAFAVTDKEACAGKTVVLVDDVCTTGATGNECAKKLFKAKVSAVYFLTATSLPELRKAESNALQVTEGFLIE